jgi:hypothetical protein
MTILVLQAMEALFPEAEETSIALSGSCYHHGLPHSVHGYDLDLLLPV